ncbi:hypothetical protein GUITHDRAFT_113767 [Guillardia theta CCMP2712]|uniref:Palmitoyltransferase n=1 Tax=Guillardia theta (strain CCMP2712) TaxID=905079 RepID=L1IW07_GUITC|nr:hypothetical protein GUITHDRAFT_113767 [Guillardia theta CCMP2712]EKX40030.1 hypothetical protein GUITHDRAFT_113767 [Guillardia theta CCMP2712]|eukprot:XP_005827010.1 hypothetical protein GUITHDRAFT_113767 [Guillardia theta CCMP2712]
MAIGRVQVAVMVTCVSFGLYTSVLLLSDRFLSSLVRFLCGSFFVSCLYGRLCIGDPGYVSGSEEEEEDGNGAEEDEIVDSGFNGVSEEHRSDPRYCELCEQPKPRRARHCKRCGRQEPVREKRGSEIQAAGKCVGIKNHPTFMLFCFLLNVCQIDTIIVCVSFIIRERSVSICKRDEFGLNFLFFQEDHCQTMFDAMNYVVLAVTAWIAITLFFFNLFHLYIASEDLTTHEFYMLLKKRALPRWLVGKEVNINSFKIEKGLKTHRSGQKQMYTTCKFCGRKKLACICVLPSLEDGFSHYQTYRARESGFGCCLMLQSCLRKCCLWRIRNLRRVLGAAEDEETVRPGECEMDRPDVISQMQLLLDLDFDKCVPGRD